MAAASGCSRREGSGMPVVHGLRVSFEARTSIRSTTIYLNSAVHYIVTDKVPDTGVRG